MMTTERIFWLLDRDGPLMAREIAERLHKRRMPVYKALGALHAAGVVERTGDVIWWRVYGLVPGARPPEDGRGMSRSSRVHLKVRAQHDWWQPCALAQLLPFPLADQRNTADAVGAGDSARPQETQAA